MEETRFDAELNRTKIDREETSFDAATKFDKDVVVNNKIGSQQQTPKIPAQENAEGGRSEADAAFRDAHGDYSQIRR